MRSLGEMIVQDFNLANDLKLDTRTLILRLNDPSWYPPDKRIVLALALIDWLQGQAGKNVG